MLNEYDVVNDEEYYPLMSDISWSGNEGWILASLQGKRKSPLYNS